MQNNKVKFKIIRGIPGYQSFSLCALRFTFSKQEGITLLLVVVLLSAILSISVGVFNVVFGEFRVSGEVADSFRALYAADQGIERTLYLDRQLHAICPPDTGPGPDCFVRTNLPVQSGGRYNVRVSKESGKTRIIVSGQNREGTNEWRVVKRGFQVSY